MSPPIRLGTASFGSSSDHLSFPLGDIEDIDELRKLSLFAQLRSISFGGTNLGDVGLLHVSRVPTLESLDLQDTEITNDGLACLEALPRLASLRLKGNLQLTNACVPRLLRLVTLSDLQVQETSIDHRGLSELESNKSLRNICLEVWNGNHSFETLLSLSRRMPDCTILAKGHGEFFQGRFDGVWKGDG